MKFSKHLRSANHAAAVFSGAIILVIGLLATMEGIARGLFNNPTSWSLDICQYLLIWAIFLGSAYAFQEKAHVAVDFIRGGLGRKLGSMVQRQLAIIGYFLTLIYVVILAWSSVDMMAYAAKWDKLTRGTIQIPIVWLYLAILVGSLTMALTLFAILVDLKNGNDTYL